MAEAREKPRAGAIPCRPGACQPRVTKRATTRRPTGLSSSADRKASGKSSYESLTEEGSFRRYAASRKNRGDEPRRREEGGQDLVAPFDGHPRNGGAHAGGAQRQEIHSG